jgi:hypothetical protein
MPLPSDLEWDNERLSLTRDEDDSCYLVSPWAVPPHGQLAITSATLMDCDKPYQFLVELTRGKINQLRNQASDWQLGGLHLPDELARRIQSLAIRFGTVVCDANKGNAPGAQELLVEACSLTAELVALYRDQVFAIRHQRQAELDTPLGVRVDATVEEPPMVELFRSTFNRAVLPMSWHQVEAEETVYRWEEVDRLLDWIEAQGYEPTAGPLVDFSAAHLPAWLWLWERDVPSMATFMCRFVESAIRRYRRRIRRWQVTAASNWANVLGLSEEDLLGLTYRLGETARSVDPSLELVLGIAQPWGEYRRRENRYEDRCSPFQFADNLIRSGLQINALDLEIVMGVGLRGSYCRDELELSRLLDMYAMLGVPLSVTLGLPAAPHSDPNSDPELLPGLGYWQDGFDPAAQANWTGRMASLALCKPYVRAVNWCHLSDAKGHTFPHAGLVDCQGTIRPAAAVLRQLREKHLR